MENHCSGVERLYRLIHNEYCCDYRYGFYKHEDSHESYFRISYNESSFLHRLGMAPELVICADAVKHKYIGVQDFDKSKMAWFFLIPDDDIQTIAEAESIQEIFIHTLTSTSKEDILNLNKTEPNVWKAFFSAAVAECVEEVKGSRELDEFYIQRLLAEQKKIIKGLLCSNSGKRDALATLALNPEESDISQLFIK